VRRDERRVRLRSPLRRRARRSPRKKNVFDFHLSLESWFGIQDSAVAVDFKRNLGEGSPHFPSRTEMEGQQGEGPQSTADLSAFVQNLLSQMQSRFQQMSDSIITRIDEMGERIDDLEKSVGDLVQQAEDDVNAPAPEGAVTPAK
jgi:heat shock factor-binding protein 1